jgi:hypothetical protein
VVGLWLTITKGFDSGAGIDLGLWIGIDRLSTTASGRSALGVPAAAVGLTDELEIEFLSSV